LGLKVGKTVKIYVCGVTPYDSAHLGHVFTFMTYDLLQRRLEDLGHEVKMVRNITDVDEPIYARANEMGITYTELAQNEIKSFRYTMKVLNFRPPYAEPLASEYIDEMADAVKALLRDKFAYYVGKDVYFDIARYPGYGKFSGFSERLQLGLSAMRGGDLNPDKRHPLDFLLWKSVVDPNDTARWNSIVGVGRPGWHIECSVMSSKLLGLPLDIHGGGNDLIYPHHSAEIAQTYGLGHPALAKHWVHVSPMFGDGEKMSKSLGNLVFARELLNKYEPAVIRLALMHYHHRIGGEWQPELLLEADKLLGKIRQTMSGSDKKSAELLLSRVRLALDDDLNAPEVVNAFGDFIQSQQSPLNHQTSGEALVRQALALVGLE